MTEWIEFIKTAGVAVGVLLIGLYWFATFLVPQLLNRMDAAIASFKEALEEERKTHERINSALLDRNQRVMDELLEHFKNAHVAR